MSNTVITVTLPREAWQYVIDYMDNGMDDRRNWLDTNDDDAIEDRPRYEKELVEATAVFQALAASVYKET
jgi:hypothetical protein